MNLKYFKSNLNAFVNNRSLLRQMVVSKLIVGQKELMLGYLWWILEPLLFMLVYWLLVSIIFQRGAKDYPLFVLCGLVPFRAFAISFSQSVGSISGKFSLLSQLNFPRAYLPFTDVLVNHIKLIFGLGVVVAFSLLFGKKISSHLLYLVVPFGMQFLFVSGLSLITAVLGVYFRDLKNLMQFTNRMMLYLSPVIYSIESVPETFRRLYQLNPIACWVEGYRQIIMFERMPDIDLIVIGLAESVVIFFFGYLLFSQQERKILKYI